MTTSRTAQLQDRWGAVMMRNYGTPSVALASGRGCRVTDVDGRDYLDLIAGIAVSCLGHAHPAILAAVTDQAARIAHTSNLVINEPALQLAERLAELAGGAGRRVFFSNDGASANEAAVKLTRRLLPDRRRFVAADRAFHGRTMGALALTGKPSAREPFAPYGIDVAFVPYGDSTALADAVDDTTAAVFLEPTLGESGIIAPPEGYLAAARSTCDRHGALLVIDEVQAGIGRTGAWFAHQSAGVVPDVVTVAKGLGGGFPIGACIAAGAAADALRAGDHGSTFGGNPVSCAAALAVLDTIDKEGLLDHVVDVGGGWQADLAAVAHPLLTGVRGRGLWLALAVAPQSAAPIEAAARDTGFLVNAVAPDAIRLAPPLVLTADEARSFTEALPTILDAAAPTVAP